MDIDQIAESFVKHYYTIFDQGKASIAQLGSLYVSLTHFHLKFPH